MVGVGQSFFLVNQYVPHGHCYLWQTPLVGLHALSDGMIAIAYYLIPIALLYFVRQREDITIRKEIQLKSEQLNQQLAQQVTTMRSQIGE